MLNTCSIWVDPVNGYDKNLGLQPRSGDWDGPVKTLRRAVKAVGELRASGDLCPVRIVLLGDVFLDSTLVIDVPGVTIDCRSHRIVGGIALTDWEQDELDGKNCVSCALPENCPDFGDLWVDSRRAVSPRFPAKGYLEAARTENDLAGGSPALYDGPGWFEVKPGDLDGADISEETCVNFVHYWIDEHTPIESFDPDSGRITLKNRAVFRAGQFDRASRVRFYLSGSRGDFGAENSWYLDKKNRKVYYAGNASEALVPTISTLMEIKADDVRIEDAVFTCTKGEHESIGIDGKPRASDPQSVCDAGGAIVFSGAKNCSISGCNISGVGLYGVEIGKGCRAVRVENCTLSDLGAGGIKITGGAAGEPEENVTSFCAIRGCEISHTGARYLAGCGVLARDTSYLEVTDCRIHHTGYSGISVGWVWGYADSATFGCRIAQNRIHDIGTGELSDLAGIYLLGTQRGTVIEYNRIHRIRCADYLAGGIYTDEGSGCVRIENNVVFDAQTAAFFQHYGRNNVVENNVFALSGACADIAKAELHRTVVFQNNLCLCDGVPVFGKQKGAKTLVSCRNLFFDRKGKLQVFEGVGLDEFKKSGRDSGSEEADPGFADPDGGDFTLREGSPAEKLGFKPIKGFPATE